MLKAAFPLAFVKEFLEEELASKELNFEDDNLMPFFLSACSDKMYA